MRRAVLIALCLTWLTARSQVIDFAAPVSFDYEATALQAVMSDLTDRYGVHFSYSRSIVPLDYPISATVEQTALVNALESLFDNTPIVYGFIGEQVVLSVDPDLLVQMMSDEGMRGGPVAGLTDRPVRMEYHIPMLTRPGQAVAGYSVAYDLVDRELLSAQRINEDRMLLLRQVEQESDPFRVQVTLFPPLQAVSDPESDLPVNFSFNVLWGVTEAVEGLEIGLLANYVKGNFAGAQFGGLYNGVGLAFHGFQASALVNTVKLNTDGAQFAGLVNVSGLGGDLFQGSGLVSSAGGRVLFQASGLVSVAPESDYGQVSGLVSSSTYSAAQVSGLVSISRSSYAQVSGLVNVGGSTNAQIAGLANVSEYADAQVASLMNIGRVVNTQVGLFNIADSSRTSVGLFSLVRSGYKAVELAGEDVMHANMNFRTGVRSFYNIFNVSSTFDLDSWALGYGIGWSMRAGGRTFCQLELVTRHVNENTSWTSTVNLLNQLKLNWDVRVGRNMSIAFGPVLNIMTSKLFNSETGTYGSELPWYTFYDRTFFDRPNGPLNVKAWVGFNVGIRFNSREREVYPMYD